jgi:hypothetical protein
LPPADRDPETEYDYPGALPSPPIVKKTPWWSTAIQYLIILALCFGVGILVRKWQGDDYHTFRSLFPALTPGAILFFSLSFAFTWVRILKWGVTKPFSCVKCMTGWSALLFAWLFHADVPVMYLFTGLFVGAMFEAVSMRWL